MFGSKEHHENVHLYTLVYSTNIVGDSTHKYE